VVVSDGELAVSHYWSLELLAPGFIMQIDPDSVTLEPGNWIKVDLVFTTDLSNTDVAVAVEPDTFCKGGTFPLADSIELNISVPDGTTPGNYTLNVTADAGVAVSWAPLKVEVLEAAGPDDDVEPDDDVDPNGTVDDDDDTTGMSMFVWIGLVIIVLVVVAIALGVVWFLMRKKEPEDLEEETGPAVPEAPPVGEDLTTGVAGATPPADEQPQAPTSPPPEAYAPEPSQPPEAEPVMETPQVSEAPPLEEEAPPAETPEADMEAPGPVEEEATIADMPAAEEEPPMEETPLDE
jgi:hypothetical protein